ncbi:O-antigen ligase [Niveispirillum sp.]|uniref:O-antigen ligase family protein n=1 Tax=Niveispirillum sp. TaxID=1917217 RepID=UPI001B49B224|nr:O-antigen ligase family protein [Niveispirillum sp.]MBP7337573.1 O-antigen ligase family protein [Niveispirillum sp.]
MSVSDGTGRIFTSFLGIFGCIILAVLVPLVPLGLAPGMAVLSVLCAAAFLWHRRFLPLPDRGLLLALGLFLAWTGLSLFWSVGGGKASTGFFSFLYLWLPALVFLSLMALVPADTARRVARWLLLAAALGAALFAVELLADQPIQHWAAGPDKEVLDYERDLNRAALLQALLAGPVALLLWRLGRRVVAGLALFLPLLMAVDSTSQSSVAALVGLIILLAVAVLSWRVAAGLVAAGVVAGTVLCGPVAHWMMAAGLSRAAWMPDSFRHRIMTWDFVADHLGDHPWIGWGLESSRAIPGGQGVFPDTGPLGWPVLPVHPHNLFLQVRLELGWVGAVLAALLLLAILRRLTRLDPGIRPMAIALLGACIFTQCFAYGAWQGWLICGMLFGGALVALAGRVKAPS